MAWRPTSASRRRNRCPPPTSRGCRRRQAPGSQGELDGEEVRAPDTQGARAAAGRALLAETTLTGSSVGEQTDQIFAYLEAILDSCGRRLDRLVKATVFLARMEDVAGVNKVYKRHAGMEPPARSTVQVAKLPAGALVEIDVIAHTSYGAVSDSAHLKWKRVDG